VNRFITKKALINDNGCEAKMLIVVLLSLSK